MSKEDPDDDDALRARRLLAPLEEEERSTPLRLHERILRRARLDILLRDVADFVALRFFHPRRRDERAERD